MNLDRIPTRLWLYAGLLAAWLLATGALGLYGLGAAGEAGVDHVLGLLRDGVSRTMALTGRRSIAEIDRTLAEAMADPLLHMVRNAVDHGIETPDARAKSGKPAGGRQWGLATGKLTSGQSAGTVAG